VNHSAQRLFDQTEAGCRVLINLLLLRVASTMSDENTDVNIIPEYPIAKTVLAENRSFGGVVDFLMAKLPARYTDHLLRNPVISLNNPDLTPITTNIFETKRDRVDAAIPQVALAAASHCKQHSLPVLRGCITSGEQWVFFIYEAKEFGGLVSCSSEYSIGQQFQDLPLILGILRDWVDNTTNSQSVFFYSYMNDKKQNSVGRRVSGSLGHGTLDNGANPANTTAPTN